MESVFETFSIDRAQSRWEEKLYSLSPVEQIGSLLFKREDKFAPLGYGGINGSKLRQCIWLVSEYVKAGNSVGVISGTSVKSPQLPMGSAVAEHFGLKSLHVIGATKPSIALKHPNVAMATWFGAKFFINEAIAYNPVLQKKVKSLREQDPSLAKFFYLEYGITLDHKHHLPERIERFHFVGSQQVQNLPDSVENLIIPAGSCNSATSILYGLARFRPKNLKKVFLIGIGPNKIDLIEERLKIIQEVAAVSTGIFRRKYVHHPEKQQQYKDPSDENLYDLYHFDLHSTGYVDYQDEVPFKYKGIELHPTYEGKVMMYLCEKLPELLTPKSMFWIVGSKPRWESMFFPLKERPLPTRLDEYV